MVAMTRSEKAVLAEVGMSDIESLSAFQASPAGT